MDAKISPSIMCADYFELEQYISQFEKCQIELIHVDIMDGSFVPNYTLGTDFIKALKKRTAIPLDIHLMINRPEDKIDWFEFGPGDYVSVHAESTPHLHKAISAIKAKGAKAMAAINPATPASALQSILDDIDGVLVMTVDPGFAGQKLIDSTLKKIRDLRRHLDSDGYENIEIEVDGNVSFVNAERMRQAGANIFVAGTSSIFSENFPLSMGIEKLRKAIGTISSK